MNIVNDAPDHGGQQIPHWALPTQLMWDVAQNLMIPIVDPHDVDDHTAAVLYARNVTATTGECPECGARVVLPSRQRRRAAVRAGTTVRIAVEHEDGCLAGDTSVPNYGDALDAAMRADERR